MSGGGLRVDPDGVHAAAGCVAAAATGVSAHLTVAPCAADAASHAAAFRLGTRAAAVLAATAALDEATAAAGRRLKASAETYVAQDIAAGSGLRAGAVLGGTPGESVTATPLRVVPPVAVVSTSGVQPMTGKQAAALIHGGAGTAGMLTAADALDGHAARCLEAAADLGASRAQAQDSWSSPAAEHADAHLVALSEEYAGQARAACELADEIRSHAADFARARGRIPAPQIFDDLEARITAAVAANAHPGTLGKLTTPILVLQAKLAAAHHDGWTGYAGYQAESDHTGERGSSSGLAVPQHDEPSEEDSGSVPSNDIGSEAEPVVRGGGLSAPVEEMMQSVLPAVLGGVLSVAGGFVGALNGAAQQLQQAGTGLAGGLAQGASGMLGAEPPRGDPAGTRRGDTGGGDGRGPTAPAGDGQQPGDTEPASAPGALTAGLTPAAAATPAVASPATFSASGTPAVPAAAPADAAMLPPMMPVGGAGSGGGENDQRLYGPRRLRVETPPNAEPVKGRREARRGRAQEAGDD